MTHPALERFVASFDTASPTEETFDLGLIADAPAEVVRAAEDALMERAEDYYDPQAVATLVALGTTRARPVLERLTRVSGPVGEAARRGLHALFPSAETTRAVAGDAAFAGSTMGRFAAVHALSLQGQGSDDQRAEARIALRAALADPDPLVRAQALDGLVRLYDLTDFETNADKSDVELRSPLRRMRLLLTSSLATLARLGAAEITGVLDRLDAGDSPDAAGLRYRGGAPDAFRRTLGTAVAARGQALPLDDIRAAGDHDRAWAETLLAVRLAPGIRDPRAPAALAALDARWTLPALEAVAGELGDLDPAHPFAAAVADAVDRLRA